VSGLRESGKRLILGGLDFPWLFHRDLRIFAGPLKGSRMPRETALENFASLFGQYESDVVSELVSRQPGPRVAYDVGAHIGLISLAMAKRARRVYAFEPVAENCALMDRLVTLNELQNIVRIVPAALGKANGRQHMFDFGASSMHFLETASAGQDVRDCPSRYVTLMTLDSFVFEQDHEAPDLLKIDVEGAESHVIEGGSATLEKFKPTLIIEIHGPGSAAKTWDLLERFLYSWTHLTSGNKYRIASRPDCISLFSRDSWTHHFLLQPMSESHPARRIP